MTSEWHKSTSGVMPETVDTTSSKFYVLVHRNIEYVNGMYEYEEKFVDRKDWEVYEDILTVTPYTETKTAYIGDTEVVFTDVPSGNLTVFIDNMVAYNVSRDNGIVRVSFEPLEEVITVTLSIS